MQPLSLDQALVAGGIIGGVLAAAGVFAFVFYILLVIAGWKIFKKAGIAGWKSLIPIYNIYLLYKLSGIKNWFWYTIAVAVICSVIISMSGSVEVYYQDIVTKPSALGLVAMFVESVFFFCAGLFFYYRLAKAFGKGIGFMIGLIFLPNIFTLILGFGSAKYDKKVLKK